VKTVETPTGTPLNPYDFSSKYMDISTLPLYSFGFGLSYTTFKYGDVKISSKEISKDDSLTVTCTVSNTGSVDGDEVVQLYIRDLFASATRPVKELKAFSKIHLKAGQQQEVQFVLKAKDFAFYDATNSFVVEPGVFHLWVAPNSQDGEKVEVRVK